MGVHKKLVMLTIKEKSDILKKLEKGKSVKAICEEYKVHKSTICRINKNQNKIKKFVVNAEAGPGKRKSLKICEYPKMEKALYRWFIQQRERHVPVSIEILKAKAVELHNKIRERPGNFNASNGWYANFKKRHGIRILKICGEKLSNKQESTSSFVKILQSKIEELNLTESQIYNADESGLFYKLLPSRTLVHFKEASAPGRKSSKERITFLVCANATGTHKIKLFVIGKSSNPRVLKNCSIPAIYRGNKSAWMTLEFFKEWFNKIFVPEVKKFHGPETRVLLLIDNAPCHPKNGELKSDDGMITVICLPPNCTAILQPMDQNVINLLKIYYKKSLLAHVVSSAPDFEANIKAINLKIAICLLSNAWERLGPDSIKKCWKPLLTTADTDWDEEDSLPLAMIRTRILENLEPLKSIETFLQDITPNETFSKAEIEEWIAETNIEITLPGHVEDTIEIADSSEDDIEPIEVEMKSAVSINDAITSFNTCLKWAEENSVTLDDILVLHKLRELALTKKNQGAVKQSTIFNYFNKI